MIGKICTDDLSLPYDCLLNDISDGGVRLPDIEAPLGVHAAQQEPKSFSCALAGAFLPFTQAQIAARYKDRDDYVNRIRTAARKLEADRLLLPEDAAVIINQAASLPWPPSAKKQ